MTFYDTLVTHALLVMRISQGFLVYNVLCAEADWVDTFRLCILGGQILGKGA